MEMELVGRRLESRAMGRHECANGPCNGLGVYPDVATKTKHERSNLSHQLQKSLASVDTGNSTYNVTVTVAVVMGTSLTP